MAEIAAASSVGGLLSLTIQVIQISQRYVSGVRNASKTIKGYFRELEVMRLVLTDLDTASQFQTHELNLDSSVIAVCSDELEQLRSKLSKRTASGSQISHLNRLTWPFAEDDTRRLTEVLHRYQSSLHVLLSTQNYRFSAATLTSIENVKARQDQDIKERLVQRLSTADPLVNHTAARDKHERATGEWFLRSKAFTAWKDDPCHNIWIRSIPGAGKTILCSTIIDHLLRGQNADEFILFYYFDFRDDRKQSLGSLLRSLIAQICVRSDHVPENIQSAFDTGVVHDTRHLKDLFATLTSACGHVKVVIDALDESHERQQVLDFLSDAAQTLCGTVQWLVTSRHEQDIETALIECTPLIVSLNKDLIDTDIELHIDSCLLRDRILSTRPAWIKQKIRDTLLDKSNGMFQYVQCQLGVLRKCLTGPATEAALCSLPAGIDETYDRMLLGVSFENWTHVRTALMFLAFAARPMRVEEIAEAATVSGPTKPFDPRDRLFDCKDIITLAAGLIVRDETSETISLAHYSIQEYLLSPRVQHGPANFFALAEEDSQRGIAGICMSYMLSVSELTVGYYRISQDFPLLEYASQHWLEHAKSSLHDATSASFRLLMHVIDGRKGAHRFWLTYHDAHPGNRTALESLFSALSPEQILTVLQAPGFLALPHAMLVSELFSLFIVNAKRSKDSLNLDLNFEVLDEVLKIAREHFSHPFRRNTRVLLCAKLCIMASESHSVDWKAFGKAITIILFGRYSRKEALQSSDITARNSHEAQTDDAFVHTAPPEAAEAPPFGQTRAESDEFTAVLEEIKHRLMEAKTNVSPQIKITQYFEQANLEIPGLAELEPEFAKFVNQCATHALCNKPPRHTMPG